MAVTIRTSQAPAAKPLAKSVKAQTSWVTILEAPEYDIPVVSIGAERRIAPGLVEIASPLIATCTTSSSATIDVRIQRADFTEAMIVVGSQVFLGEPSFIPLNGTMLVAGDKLQVRAGLSDEVDVTISATVGQAEEDDVS